MIVIALYRLKLLHPGLIDLMRLPANKSRSLYLSIVVLAAGIAVYLVAVGVPATKYGVPTSSPAKLFELPLTSVSPTQYQSFLSGFNEEIFRAGYLVNGLSHPLLNALLWAVAHPHSLQRIERRWGVDLSDSPYKNAFLKTVLISYFFAMLLQGLLLLWLMRKTQSVWPSILCHLAHNALV
ncbi:type II CAAX prenyl endopeptidase Rce1 family protein [Meiothermus sp.]|uniref:CPBP family glutamic-type intramembrane protease n=1 Tax=Meiothermus sp. TaxID=1955249 RepID=UPI00261366B2|nr:CPBP family glutamic-type intramembrane protease [Meiothermus sp.]